MRCMINSILKTKSAQFELGDSIEVEIDPAKLKNEFKSGKHFKFELNNYAIS